jgi:hypothetical protein
MAHAYRAIAGVLAAAAVARGSITVSWNTHRVPAPLVTTSSRVSVSERTGMVRSVHGTHVLLRLSDGTTRLFIATPEQAKLLQGLVGTQIQFRTP